MSDFTFKSGSFGWVLNVLGALFLGALGFIAGCRAIVSTRFWQFGILVAGWGAYNLVFVMRTWNKWSDVTVDLDGIVLVHGSSQRKFNWNQVKQCVKVRHTPLISWFPQSIYRLTFRGSQLVTYFVPGPPRPRPQGLWEPHYESMLDVIDGEVAKAQGQVGGAI